MHLYSFTLILLPMYERIAFRTGSPIPNVDGSVVIDGLVRVVLDAVFGREINALPAEVLAHGFIAVGGARIGHPVLFLVRVVQRVDVEITDNHRHVEIAPDRGKTHVSVHINQLARGVSSGTALPANELVATGIIPARITSSRNSVAILFRIRFFVLMVVSSRKSIFVRFSIGKSDRTFSVLQPPRGIANTC